MTKYIKYLSAILFGAVVCLTTSCDPKPLTEADVFKSADSASIAALTKDGHLYTIHEFLDKYMTEEGDSIYQKFYRTNGHYEGGDYYLFTINNIPTDGEGVYIMGRVATNDTAGNYYKTMVIQQMVAGKQQTLRLSIDMGSLNALYQQGQMILIRCNGLSIGRYANQPQLCVPAYNNNVYASSAEKKVGWAPGRIPAPRFMKATTLIGIPEPTKLYYEEMTMTELNERYLSVTEIHEVRALDAHLVKLKNVHFTGGYIDFKSKKEKACTIYDPTADNDTIGNPKEDENANVFGPKSSNGSPISRLVTDESGIVAAFSASEYAKFAYFYLPSIITRDTVEHKGKKVIRMSFDYAAVTGDICGIIGLYYSSANEDYPPTADSWSISPSAVNADLDMYYEDATGRHKWVPEEFSTVNYKVEEKEGEK